MQEVLIKAEHLSKKFHDGSSEITVLKDVNFEIRANEFIAINGPSGSGKSTLLTILGGLQKPNAGVCYLNDVSMYDLSDKELSNLRFNDIGFILQTSNLVPFLTVYDQFNLQAKYAKKKIDKQKVDGILNDLGIAHLKNKYPNELSGGEKQRVAIGVCLYNEPTIILADEPTASLDSEKAFKVVDILKRISKSGNRSVVMVTHDLRMLDKCDSVYTMSDGVMSKTK